MESEAIRTQTPFVSLIVKFLREGMGFPAIIGRLAALLLALAAFAPGTAHASATYCSVTLSSVSQTAVFTRTSSQVQADICAGTSGTPDYVGTTNKQPVTGTATDDTYPNYGNAYVLVPYNGDQYNSADNEFGWSYTPDSSPVLSSATHDKFEVRVYDINGILLSVITYDLTITPPGPTVSSISPTTGPASGGTSVTITGTNFTGATAVAFGGTAASSFTVNSATQITATSPAGSGTVDVRVTTPGGTSATSGSDQFTYAAALSAATAGISFSPSSLSVGSTGTMTITIANPNASAMPASSVLLTFDSSKLTRVTGAPGGTCSGVSGNAPTTSTVQFTNVTVAANSSCTITLSFTGAGVGTSTMSTDAFTPTGWPTTAAATSNTITVSAPTITVSPSSLPGATVGSAYSQTLTASGGTAPYTYAVTTGALPAGLSLSSSGALSGTPTAGGTFNFTVTATDTGSFTGAQVYTLTVAAPTIALAPSTLPGGAVGTAYSQTVSASGGTAPYTYAVTAGALPTGLSLSSSGALSGTPSGNGTFNFTITATDSSTGTGPYTGSQAYSVTISAPTITVSPSSLPGATVGSAYSQTLTASGGTAPYTYAVTTGALPAGLSLSSSGALSGTPTAGGTFNFTVTATDTGSFTGAQALSIVVGTASQTITFTAPPTTSLSNSPVTLSATASSGLTVSFASTTPAVCTVSGTSVTLLTTGTCSIDADQAGDANYLAAPTVTRSFQVTPTTLAATAAQPNVTATVGQALAAVQPVTASGGTTPYSYALSASLPAGLSFSTSTGQISGTPTAGLAATAYTVTVSDAGSQTAQAGFSLAIAAPTIALSPSSLPGGTAGSAYSATVSASGGVAPYTYAVTSGALPAGMTLSASGQVSGTPTASGSFAFTVTATDSATGTGPFSGSRAYTIDIAAPTLTLTPASLPGGTAGQSYSAQFSASGGIAPYTYAVTGGSLPSGLTLGSDGKLTGSPSAEGSYTFTVTATDSTAGTAASVAQAYSVAIAIAAPVAGPVTATVAYGSSNNSVAPVLSGGAASSIAIDTAPSHGTASISGQSLVYTPAAGFAGSDSFTYTATNATATSAPATVSITVSQPTLAIGPGSLAAGQMNSAYSAQLTGTGGAAPYSFTVSSGALPAGLTLSASGAISGTPSAAGTSSFTVKLTDSSTGDGPFTVTRDYALTIDLPPPPTTSAVPPLSTLGTSTVASHPVTVRLADYASGDYTALQIATQPAHGTVALASGPDYIATYTPALDYAGTDSFAFVAVGPGGQSSPRVVTIAVAGVPPVAPSLTVSATQSTPVTVQLTDTASGGPYTGATVGTITPSGSLTATISSSGSDPDRTYAMTITPAPTFSGTAVITYTLSNQYGASDPATITVQVAARPDPSADPTVTGISAAQADAASRFARGQTDNFMRRNEQLHHGGGGSGGASNALTLAGGDGYIVPPPGSVNTIDPRAQQAWRSALRSAMDNSARGGGRGFGRSDASADGGKGRPIGSIAIWAGGAVNVGTRDQTTQRDRLHAESQGLSSGFDVRVGDRLFVGFGGGYGWDSTSVGEDGHVDGHAWSLAAYGSWQPSPSLFIDATLGWGDLRFNTTRDIAANGLTATGRRDGTMLFGSIAAGIDRENKLSALSIYGRLDFMRADLDAYTEQNGGVYSLAFAARKLNSLSSVLGLRDSLRLDGWTPHFRVEWRHEFRDVADQLVDYADVGSYRYRITGDGWMRDTVTGELGFDISLGRGWAAGLDLNGGLGSGGRYGGATATVRKSF